MSTTQETRTELPDGTIQWTTKDSLLDQFFLVFVLPVTLTLAALIPIGVALDWHTQHVACLRLHEQTSYATHMAGNAWSGECYMHINNRWTPANQYRTTDQNKLTYVE